MRKQISLFIFLLISVYSYSQSLTVSGTVTEDSTGDPLPGVNIIIKNTTKGTQTDFDGNYTLADVPKGSILIFSSIGYENQEIPANSSKINVVLKESAEQLEEVVIVGYGKQKKKDVTGAVSLVGEKTLDALKPVDASTALQGTTSGVAVNLSSGAPGAAANILIRGVSSNTNNKPLIIVDGYEGDLNSVNPNDIESITVLKDAQAAIYGIKGANGVVLVTTKIGKKNKAPTVKYDVYSAIQQTTRKLDYFFATITCIM